jgi:hypothetical protein
MQEARAGEQDRAEVCALSDQGFCVVSREGPKHRTAEGQSGRLRRVGRQNRVVPSAAGAQTKGPYCPMGRVSAFGPPQDLRLAVWADAGAKVGVSGGLGCKTGWCQTLPGPQPSPPRPSHRLCECSRPTSGPLAGGMGRRGGQTLVSRKGGAAETLCTQRVNCVRKL